MNEKAVKLKIYKVQMHLDIFLIVLFHLLPSADNVYFVINHLKMFFINKTCGFYIKIPKPRNSR